jgi:hypothetical protein
MRKSIFILSMVVVFLLAASGQSVQAQSTDSQYFAETGHYVTGEFWTFYNANSNARLVYGLPITESYIDQSTGVLVQYFQNVRMELHTNNPEGSQVVLAPLGSLMYEQGTVIDDLTASTPNCFQEIGWGYPVCYSFYDFYTEQGGEAIFGKPVSGLEYMHGRLVQSFEHGKLVWKPENPINAQVTIAPLGLQYFYFTEEDNTKLAPIRNFEYNLQISDIHAKMFCRTPILGNGSSQTIYIIAKDQNNTPLIGSVVQITLYYPDGTTEIINHTATDENGLAQMTFNASSAQNGVVTIEAKIEYNSLETSTVTSFRIWY